MAQARSKQKSYRVVLREEFERRREKNPAFTIRAFSKFLKVSPSTLHGLLKEQRHFQNETAIKVAEALNWSSEQFDNMLAEIEHARSKKIAGIRPAKEFYELCSWPLMSIARLALLEGVPADPVILAKKINVTEVVAREALNHLISRKFIKVVRGRIKPLRSSGPFHVPTPNQKALEYQQDILAKAANALADVPSDKRLSLIRMIPLDERRMGQLARLIGQMAEEIELKGNPNGEGKSLYGISLQVFPICSVD